MNSMLQETQIFGPINSYAYYTSYEKLIIEKHENYQKRSYRNRYNIQTSNGIQTLSIPLSKGKNNQMKITDVLISYDENWTDIHLQTIRSAYGKSPYFEFYFDAIKNIFITRYSHLFDLNMECLNFVLKAIYLNIEIGTTESYEIEYKNIIDHRNHNIKPSAHKNQYTQVWAEKFDFMPNLSILDLLFCMGPAAVPVLRNIS